MLVLSLCATDAVLMTVPRTIRSSRCWSRQCGGAARDLSIDQRTRWERCSPRDERCAVAVYVLRELPLQRNLLGRLPKQRVHRIYNQCYFQSQFPPQFFVSITRLGPSNCP